MTSHDVVAIARKRLGTRKIAEMFNVSRRLIQFILDPEKHKENLERRKERGGSKIYYKKEQHTKAIREHREYKKEILKTIKHEKT